MSEPGADILTDMNEFCRHVREWLPTTTKEDIPALVEIADLLRDQLIELSQLLMETAPTRGERRRWLGLYKDLMMERINEMPGRP